MGKRHSAVNGWRGYFLTRLSGSLRTSTHRVAIVQMIILQVARAVEQVTDRMVAHIVNALPIQEGPWTLTIASMNPPPMKQS